MSDDLATFLVRYHYVPDMESRRGPHREAHLAWLRELAAAGTVVLAGATRDPVDTGVIVVRAASQHDVRKLLVDDPYAAAGLITGTEIRPIGLAVGG